MQVVWTRRAIVNLDQAREYVRQEYPAAAMRMGGRIEQAVASLPRFPEAGRPGRVEGTRELIVTGTPYLVVYRVRGCDVQILRVLHGKQKWPSS